MAPAIASPKTSLYPLSIKSVAKGQTISKQLIINTNPVETRIALLHEGRLEELFIEREHGRSRVGNIYRGIVTRVLPGMQAAFVNAGLERTAFLYGGDVLDPELVKLNREAPLSGPDDEDQTRLVNRTPIEKLLKEGEEVVIQVAKEALGSKGARVTMFLSLPGRYLVLMPNFNHIGISRRIEDEEERHRLYDLVRQIKPDGVGVIVRTAAEGVDSGHLQKDLKYLSKVWRTVDGKSRHGSPPQLIYQDLSIIFKTTRDLYNDEIGKIVIDDSQAGEELKRFLKATIPGAAEKVESYSAPKPIFDEFDIELEISKALGMKIELPSGGYLVIDQTEALTSFDVNTGKFVGTLSAQETITKTNMEAVAKIVEQLRVRNIGGIIVIDFIDMERLEDREKVYDSLQEELKKDKARTNVLKISELGLVQMTRKRTNESLEHQLMDQCPFCDGRGKVRSVATEAYDLIREMIRSSIQKGSTALKVKVREDIREWILNREAELFESVVDKYGLKVEFEPVQLDLADLREPSFEVN